MTIQNALTNFFGKKYRTHKGDIGLEIETETLDGYDIPRFSFWNSHVDNSLRNFGMEYTLKQPLDFEINFPKALDEFSDKTKGIPFVQDSITTSVHVHLNFLNDNFITLGNFLTLYSLTENLLVRASGEDRLSNLYCMPICDAEETHHNMIRLFRGVKDRKYGSLNFDAESTKYGAINLSSLQQFGSLEIRLLRGVTDTSLIKTWVGTLYSLQKYARTPSLVPPQIILNYKEKRTEYLTDIFGEYRKFIRHQDEESLIEKNFWYAAALAYEIKDWTKLEEIPKPKKPKPKDLDKIANMLYARNFEQLQAEEQQTVIHNAEFRIEEEEVREERLNPITQRYEDMTLAEYRAFEAEARREGLGIFAPQTQQDQPGDDIRQVWNTITGRMNTTPYRLNPDTIRPPEAEFPEPEFTPEVEDEEGEF